VPDVVIDGFRIIAPQSEHAIEITGAAAGVTLRTVQIDRVENAAGAEGNVAAVYLHEQARGSENNPLRLERLRIRGTVVGIVIGDDGPLEIDQVPGHIVIEEGQFLGFDENNATLMVLLHGSRDVMIRRNIFARGVCGLSVKTDSGRLPEDWQFQHNTCYHLSSCVVWTGPEEQEPSFSISDNLLIDVRFIANQVIHASSREELKTRFRNNFWVDADPGQKEKSQSLTTFIDHFSLRSTDPADADFLKPDVSRLPASFQDGPLPGRYSDQESVSEPAT
jgi:hypothetical protein